MIAWLPDALTASRILVFLPLIVFFAKMGDWSSVFMAVIIAIFTDLVDGALARKIGVFSHFGRHFDRIADTALFIANLYAIMQTGYVGRGLLTPAAGIAIILGSMFFLAKAGSWSKKIANGSVAAGSILLLGVGIVAFSLKAFGGTVTVLIIGSLAPVILTLAILKRDRIGAWLQGEE